MKIANLQIFLIIGLLILAGCSEKAELGTKKNPVKMYFVPSQETGKVIMGAEKIAEELKNRTGYEFEVAVPTSYAAVVEAMGTKEADIAWLATFAYIMANAKYGAEVELTTVRNNLEKYRGQFIAQTGSGIETIEDIQGKTIAYTDQASTSGHIYPSAILKTKGIEPGKVLLAGSHTAAVLAVYEGRADVGCTYWSPPHEGVPQDARKTVMETVPDIIDNVKIIGFTDWIPNDTVTFRKEFPQLMKDEIVNALLEMKNDKNSMQALKDLYEIDGLVKSSDADYEIVRETLRSLDTDAADYVK